MSKKVLVPIGDGSEEIETTCITDTLTRFGAEVTVASVMNGELVCKMSRGIKVSLDANLLLLSMVLSSLQQSMLEFTINPCCMGEESGFDLLSSMLFFLFFQK